MPYSDIGVSDDAMSDRDFARFLAILITVAVGLLVGCFLVVMAGFGWWVVAPGLLLLFDVLIVVATVTGRSIRYADLQEQQAPAHADRRLHSVQ